MNPSQISLVPSSVGAKILDGEISPNGVITLQYLLSGMIYLMDRIITYPVQGIEKKYVKGKTILQLS